MNRKDIENSPISSGRTNMLKFINGKNLTYKQAVLAKCFECCNGYIDTRQDCQIADCPLYGFMPYKAERC